MTIQRKIMSTISLALSLMILVGSRCDKKNDGGPASATPAATASSSASPDSGVDRSGTVTIITPPAASLGTLELQHQYTDALFQTPNPAGKAAESGPDKRDRWMLTYTNTGTAPWEGFRVTIEGDPLEQIQEALRSARVLVGFGAPPPPELLFRNDKDIDQENKGAMYTIRPPQKVVAPGQTIQIEVNTGCFSTLPVARVGCKYHLGVKPIG